MAQLPQVTQGTHPEPVDTSALGWIMDGAAVMSNQLVLMHRGMSIAGGTSEIKRNQIGERILGLPRDPLLK